MSLTSTKKFYFNTFPSILIATGVLLIVISYGPVILSELWYQYKQVTSKEYVISPSGQDQKSQLSPFGKLLSGGPVLITPVNKTFSLVIEKINVNAPVVRDVTVTDEKAYIEALKTGVAHASTSNYPSKEPGNVYLFAHASINFWQLGKYATAFNLLRKLEKGDRINIFFENQRYIYEVVNKEKYKGWNTYPLTRPVIEPILTLQTCDPPGTTFNRLVVTAKLVEVQ